MKNLTELLKTTALGGLLFLVPLVVAGLIGAKALLAMKSLGQALGVEESAYGVLVVNLLALAVLFGICLLAGFVARSAPVRRMGQRLESTLFAFVPGYSFIKGFTDSMSHSDRASQAFKPVLASFDDNAQIAFEVERSPSGNVVVYLPGAPNPWSGTVVVMGHERITPLEISMPEAIKGIRQLGLGTSALGS